MPRRKIELPEPNPQPAITKQEGVRAGEMMMTIYDSDTDIGPGKGFAKHALLFFTGLCAASCGIWEVMGAIL